MIGLTKRQNDCLHAIEALTVDGVSPTYQEIATRIGISGKSSVARMIDALVDRGHLRRYAHRSRALEVVASAAPTKTKTQIANAICQMAFAICQRAYQLRREGITVTREKLHEIVVEALS